MRLDDARGRGAARGAVPRPARCPRCAGTPRSSGRRAGVRVPARSARAASNGIATVRTGWRRAGGVASTLSSCSPPSAACRVRGMGVAVSVSACTSRFRPPMARRRSIAFWRMPKRCSSSITTSPRPGEPHRPCRRASGCRSPRRSVRRRAPARTCRASSAGVSRDSAATRMRSGARRRRNVSRCWRTSTVVGATTATCPPASATAAAARSATSVLPKPTSPHSSRSIGCPPARSPARPRWRSLVGRRRIRGSRRPHAQTVGRTARIAGPTASARSRASRTRPRAVSAISRSIAARRVVQASPSDLVERHRLGLAAVAPDAARLLNRHQQARAAGEFEGEAVGRRAVGVHRLQAAQHRQPVIEVDHHVARAAMPAPARRRARGRSAAGPNTSPLAITVGRVADEPSSRLSGQDGHGGRRPPLATRPSRRSSAGGVLQHLRPLRGRGGARRDRCAALPVPAAATNAAHASAGSGSAAKFGSVSPARGSRCADLAPGARRPPFNLSEIQRGGRQPGPAVAAQRQPRLPRLGDLRKTVGEQLLGSGIEQHRRRR